MSTMIVCLCGCPKVAHKMGKKACGQCGTCDLFELDGEVPTPRFAKGGFIVGPGPAAVIPAVAKCPCGDFSAGDPSDAHSARHTAWLNRSDAHPLVVSINAATAGESPSAALRRVEKERDDAVRRAADLEQVREHLAEERKNTRALVDAEQQLSGERDQLVNEKLALTAELATARKELELLRGGRQQLAKAYAANAGLLDEVERLRAALANTATAYVATTTETAAAEVFAFDAWQCLTPGGCGARYTRRTATTHHPCGDLTPVRVTITHREDHQ